MDVIELTRQLQELTARVELLTRQRDDARTASASLQRELDAMRAELDALQREHELLRAQTQELTRQRDDWQEAAWDRRAELLRADRLLSVHDVDYATRVASARLDDDAFAAREALLRERDALRIELADVRAAVGALQRECVELRADRLSAQLEALRDPPDGMTRLALSVSSPRWRAAVIDAALAGELLSTVLGPLAPSLSVLHDGRVTVQIDFVPPAPSPTETEESR